MFNLPNLSSRALLLSGASLAAILITAPAQATTLGGMTGRTFAQINMTNPPPRPAGFGGTTTPDQAKQNTAQSSADFSSALARIQAQMSAQATARGVAIAGPNNLGADPNHPGQQLPDVPNGLGSGGLAPSANVSVDPSLWQNADAPTQASANGQTTVTVHQNAQKAILTWDSFNVGKNTTVHFDQTGGSQSDGTNNWIALNRIVDPSDRPSQILGKIQAEGSVYLLNKNGIIFGGSSQVDVHSLIASSLSFMGEDPSNPASVAASNKLFLSEGLAGSLDQFVVDTAKLGVILGTNDPSIAGPKSGDIVIEGGAHIETGEAGYSLIAAPNVKNAGEVYANGGEAILAAGAGVTISDQGVPLAVQVDGRTFGDAAPTLINTGTVAAIRGEVTLLGGDITQGGVVLATTSISQPGSINISAGAGDKNEYDKGAMHGLVTLAPDSLIAVLPDANGDTTTSSPAADAAFVAGSTSISGVSVWFQENSLAELPGGKLSISASTQADPSGAASDGVFGRLYIDKSATLDVAGIADDELPMSANLVTVPRVGQNELADSPLQRGGILYTSPFTVDGRDSGTREDGLTWVGSPVVAAGGYVQNVPRDIDQMLINGGTISLAAAGDVIVAPGSALNVDGGYVHYQGGIVQTTRLIGADGRIYSADDADPMVTYLSLAGVDTVAHDRWAITDTFTNTLLGGATYESDYVSGGNGGTLNISSTGTTILNGAVSAQTITGRHQIGDGDLPTGSSLSLSTLAFLFTKDGIGLDDIDPDFSFTTSIKTPEMLAKAANDPTNILRTADISTDLINAAGFSNISIDAISSAPRINQPPANGFITLADGAALTVQPGGSIAMTGSSLSILGNLTARGGNISLTSTGDVSVSLIVPPATPPLPGQPEPITTPPGDVVVGSNARISAAGQWVNDAGIADEVGDNFINGGSVSIVTKEKGSYPELGGGQNANGPLDVTGRITLQPGSVIDVSSGGYVGFDGTLLTKNGVPVGQGGNITLMTYMLPANFQLQVSNPPDGVMPTHGTIAMDGTLRGYGFSGGGTLTIQAPSIQIGGDPAGLPDYTLYLPQTFFSNQGFGAYKLSAIYDATIATGSTVNVSQRNFIPNYGTLVTAPTGTDLYATDPTHPDGIYTSIGTLDTYHRQATDFSLDSGAYLNWLTANLEGSLAHIWAPNYDGVTGALLLATGATITADASAEIALSSLGQINILGSITAPGGSISLAQDFTYQSVAVPRYLNRSVWLGADSLLDVSGVVLTDPLAKPVRGSDGLFTPRTGKVLDGGSVSITSINGYVIAEKGSEIDVSGTSGILDLPQNINGLSGAGYAATLVASDAGSITLGASNGMYFDGTLIGHGGSDQMQGGTLTLAEVDESHQTISVANDPYYAPKAILLQQSGDLVPVGLHPGDAIEAGTSPSQVMHFAVDRLNGSGIDTLVVGSDPAVLSNATPLQPIAVGFVGDVNIALGRAFIANAQHYVALSNDATVIPPLSLDPNAIDSHVSITAPYVAINGDFDPRVASAYTPVLSAGNAVLDIRAGMIDITGQFDLQNVNQANFIASGDIRFYTPNDFAYVGTNTTPLPGMLVTAGDLTFQAAQLYPASDNVFILDAPTAGSTITFLGNGNVAPPLSAGGALLVDAANIVQNGTLRAPSGTIQLGVSDINDADTQAAFGNLPLVKTSSVSLGNGSVTSVSLDGMSLPYGTTTDGTDWKLIIQGSGGATTTTPDLTSSPSKMIGIAGDSVNFADGATIDLSGGGSVYAQEFVPGTGGSRDLLHAVNTTFSTGATPQQTPLYADGRPIYAVIPGYAPPVAAYDPSFGYTGSEVGKSVYLSGVKGLPDGVYTLLPAEYATVKGAFRVVQETQIQDSVPSGNTVLADGSQVVSGRFVDGISGKKEARSTSFLVQSSDVWQQYSEYTITDADTYFPAQASHAGTPATRTPVDAGQLAIAAVTSLTLDGSLDATAGTGGRGAAVDISAQDIQIVGGNSVARDGYLQIDANSLSNLGAESLLIGGTRSEGADGTTIKPTANSVVLSNDANSVLSGPEVILVTQAGSTSDPNAATGLLLEAGSVLAAKGDVAVSSTAPILIGAVGGASGDGALVRVSNGAPITVTRANVPGLDGVAGTASGLLDIRAGASIAGGNSTILDSSGNLNLDPAALFSGKSVDVNANTIAFVGAGSTAAPTGFVVGPQLLAQFANIANLGLHSRSTMDFFGDVSLDVGQNLTLGANAFTSDGGTISITAPTLALVNDIGGSSASFADGTGTLNLTVGELDLGTGTKTVQGFGAVHAVASQGIVGQGTGSTDFGDLNVALTAPVFTADSGANTSLTTTGILSLNKGDGTAINRKTLGGALSFTGGTVTDNAVIAVPAGNVSLHATSGDLTIGDNALVSTAGVAIPFLDVTAYAPAGKISLTADQGSILLASSATLDFSGTTGGGDAGSLSVSAPMQTAQLQGTLKGAAASGYQGGSFGLDIGGAVDLDTLSQSLAASGVTNQIDVHTRSGNLTLSSGNTLTASEVSLIADGGAGGQDASGGNILIAGTINASGAAGGSITLAGKSGVTLSGALIATGSDPNQRGGTVVIETSGNPNGSLDPTYGYEEVDATGSGVITIANGALIDVSGGTAGGLSNGTVSFRAPLLDSASNNDVNVTIASGATIRGARDVGLEAYAVWSTTDASTDPTKHFDGIVDPAGWYGANGTLLAGSFANAGGGSTTWDGATIVTFAVPATTTTTSATSGIMTTVSYNWDGSTDTLSSTTTVVVPPGVSGSGTTSTTKTIFSGQSGALNYLLTNDYFTPDAGQANVNHQTFYGYAGGDATAAVPGTLMGFVQAPHFSFENRFDGIQNFHARPGIELRNPDASINNGDISVLTAWNLGAGTDVNALAFRYNGQAPTLTLRADGDINVKASISDGFWQYAVVTGSGALISTSNFDTVDPEYQAFVAFAESLGVVDTSGLFAPAQNLSGDPTTIGQYYGLYQQYVDFLNTSGGVETFSGYAVEVAYLNSIKFGVADPSNAPPPLPTTANDYPDYLKAYATYFSGIESYASSFGQAPVDFQPLAAPPTTLDLIVPKPPVDNTPSSLASALNPLPLASANLAGGASSSYRLVAGADMGSADPLAVQTASFVATGHGTISLDDHLTWAGTEGGQTITSATMIRTGTGAIDIAAAGNVVLLDPVAPGVIYTGGRPADGTNVGHSASELDSDKLAIPVVVTGEVHPEAGGDISIDAQGDITGIQQIYSNGNYAAQLWWPWMATGNLEGSDGLGNLVAKSSSINFGAFDQGIMSVGGNVAITAGHDIRELSVSLPTTWYTTTDSSGVKIVSTTGGGNLSVIAGNDISSGSYFVAKGEGRITAGGQIGSDFTLENGIYSTPVSTLLALQDATLNVSARGAVDIGGIYDPSWLDIPQSPNISQMYSDGQSYSSRSSVNLVSTAGDVSLDTMSLPRTLFGYGADVSEDGDISGLAQARNGLMLPASLAMTALDGDIFINGGGKLYPSATGNLTLLAEGNIKFVNAVRGTMTTVTPFGMSDAPTSSLPSPLNPITADTVWDTLPLPGNTTGFDTIDHQQDLHAQDAEPVRIYSLSGDIVDGQIAANGGLVDGFYTNSLPILVPKPAQIYAGNDIINLTFVGQNLYNSDVTSIVAGRDIYDPPLYPESFPPQDFDVIVPVIQIAGPGHLDIQAGRDIGPLAGDKPITGIQAIGNISDPFLPLGSADISVLFGTGPGVEWDAFASSYLNPSAPMPDIPSANADLIATVAQYEADQDKRRGGSGVVPVLTADQAWASFQSLPQEQRQAIIQKEFFKILATTGADYNDPASPDFGKYARGYQAINTLFPSSLGYTQNNLEGGTNGAEKVVSTGNLDIRDTTIQTQQGGDINIMGPGGQLLVGSTSSPPYITDSSGRVLVGPQALGILAWETGAVNIFSDQSLLLAQSRVFTEQGGDMTIWSSNGDINAGKGVKTSTEKPPVAYICTQDFFCRVDAGEEVSGAGIAAFPAKPDDPSPTVTLVAPRGTVDAGDAGIRVAGDLVIAALRVENADNIQVQGKSVGLPPKPVTNLTLTAASSAATEAAQLVHDIASQKPKMKVSVEVTGFGGEPNQPEECVPGAGRSCDK